MKRLLLILVVLAGIVLLTGCCNFCVGFVTPPAQTCSFTVTAGYWVWGTIYYQIISTGQIVNTGEYIDYSGRNQATINNAPCGKEIWVYVVDNCNSSSHVEPIILRPGQNFLYFYYW